MPAVQPSQRTASSPRKKISETRATYSAAVAPFFVSVVGAGLRPARPFHAVSFVASAPCSSCLMPLRICRPCSWRGHLARLFDVASRWEPPHLCGEGALQRSVRSLAHHLRFSAGPRETLRHGRYPASSEEITIRARRPPPPGTQFDGWYFGDMIVHQRSRFSLASKHNFVMFFRSNPADFSTLPPALTHCGFARTSVHVI
jgi:hypothetical protein